MASDCNGEYDYQGYFWVAVITSACLVLFFFNPFKRDNEQKQVAAPVPQQVAPIQTVTQNAAPINITVTPAPPVVITQLRTKTVYRYVKQTNKPRKPRCTPCRKSHGR